MGVGQLKFGFVGQRREKSNRFFLESLFGVGLAFGIDAAVCCLAVALGLMRGGKLPSSTDGADEKHLERDCGRAEISVG